MLPPQRRVLTTIRSRPATRLTVVGARLSLSQAQPSAARFPRLPSTGLSCRSDFSNATEVGSGTECRRPCLGWVVSAVANCEVGGSMPLLQVQYFPPAPDSPPSPSSPRWLGHLGRARTALGFFRRAGEQTSGLEPSVDAAHLQRPKPSLPVPGLLTKHGLALGINRFVGSCLRITLSSPLSYAYL